MGERNDLIKELTEIAQDRHGAKNTHLLSWLEKGYFHCQHGSEEWCQGDYLDSARAYIERLEAVAKDALTTIASLSEALAEAEKKGAEARETLAFEFDRYINGVLMAEGVIIERQHTLAAAMREAACIAARGPQGEVPVLVLKTPPRDLSQGGQHG